MPLTSLVDFYGFKDKGSRLPGDLLQVICNRIGQLDDLPTPNIVTEPEVTFEICFAGLLRTLSATDPFFPPGRDPSVLRVRSRTQSHRAFEDGLPSEPLSEEASYSSSSHIFRKRDQVENRQLRKKNLHLPCTTARYEGQDRPQPIDENTLGPPHLRYWIWFAQSCCSWSR